MGSEISSSSQVEVEVGVENYRQRQWKLRAGTSDVMQSRAISQAYRKPNNKVRLMTKIEAGGRRGAEILNQDTRGRLVHNIFGGSTRHMSHERQAPVQSVR